MPRISSKFALSSILISGTAIATSVEFELDLDASSATTAFDLSSSMFASLPLWSPFFLLIGIPPRLLAPLLRSVGC